MCVAYTGLSHHSELPFCTRTVLNHFHLKLTIRGNNDYSNCSKVFTLFVVSFKGAPQLHATFPSLMGLPVSSLEEKCHQKKSAVFMKRFMKGTASPPS